MSRQVMCFLSVLVCGAVGLTACDSFDEDQAALQIRERVCRDWPVGCSDSTRVVIEDVNKTNNGRQVVFRLVDRADETPPLSAAYFEPRDEEWGFLLFEEPFLSTFRELSGRVDADSRLLSDALGKVKSAQRWYNSIYGRYAGSLSALDSVSYKGSTVPIEMTVADDFGQWKAVASTRSVRCEIEGPGGQIPECVGLTAAYVGTDSGPLSEAFSDRD